MVLKDLDWINSGRKLHLGVDKKRRLLAQVKKDCALLERLEVIDYSMLVGIHRTTSARDATPTRERRTSSYIKVCLGATWPCPGCQTCPLCQVGSSARSGGSAACSSCDSVKNRVAGAPSEVGSALTGAISDAATHLVPKEGKEAR